ncbi:MAG: polysaccharide deacetylase family protein [Candidatus Nealsonbacteria bacterium]|nr:polysaccharide deacetylase family protein [Candidatus Nealsonbacteria bacterium]
MFTSQKKNKIILTFDLEFWYDTEFLKEYLPESRQDCLVESVLPVLNLLKKYNAQATFFTTGKVMEKYPELIKQIHSQGHEIASHGYSHEFLGKLAKEKFVEEMKKCVELTEKTIGEKPKGFRAPCFSLNKKTSWALLILAELGFKYHSGRSSMPGSALLEVPAGYSGGVYFRLLPVFFFKYLLKKQRILYLHPHELYKDTPIIERAPGFKKFLKYYRVKDSLNKLEKLLQSFQFGSVEQVLGL